MRKIKIGVLGAAAIALRSVIPAFLGLPDLYEFVGVASRDAVGARKRFAAFGAPVHEGYEVMLDRKLVDAVYVPLPNALHFEWVKLALERGVHVLAEKSLGVNLAEVTELNELADRGGLALMENFQFRFHRQMQYVRQLLGEGRIGELRCLRSSFGFPPFPDPGNIRYQRALGGGALLDAGAYPVKVSQLFLGNGLRVAAATLRQDRGRGIDLGGGAFLRQENSDLFAEIAFGFDNFYQCNLELWGSMGKITANRIFTAPPGHSPEVILETAEGKKVVAVEADDHFQNLLRHFHAIAASGTGMEAEYQQNIHQARLLQEIKGKSNE